MFRMFAFIFFVFRHCDIIKFLVFLRTILHMVCAILHIVCACRSHVRSQLAFVYISHIFWYGRQRDFTSHTSTSNKPCVGRMDERRQCVSPLNYPQFISRQRTQFFCICGVKVHRLLTFVSQLHRIYFSKSVHCMHKNKNKFIRFVSVNYPVLGFHDRVKLLQYSNERMHWSVISDEQPQVHIFATIVSYVRSSMCACNFVYLIVNAQSLRRAICRVYTLCSMQGWKLKNVTYTTASIATTPATAITAVIPLFDPASASPLTMPAALCSKSCSGNRVDTLTPSCETKQDKRCHQNNWHSLWVRWISKGAHSFFLSLYDHHFLKIPSPLYTSALLYVCRIHFWLSCAWLRDTKFHTKKLTSTVVVEILRPAAGPA